jgi:acetyltransferase-like isoleucine patch superfamily enzyme
MRSLIKAKNILELYLFRKKWRKRNRHNETTPRRVFPIDKVRVGNYSYGPLDVYTWGANEEKLEIGSFVSIASGVKFLLGGNHRIDTLLTFPVKVKFLNEKREASSKGPIIIEDDVWIGMDAMLLSGSHICRGAIVGARAVVAGVIPPYSIAIGSPAKVVGYRFDKETINLLQSLSLECITPSFVESNSELFTLQVTYDAAVRIAEVIVRSGISSKE